jgi:hypothetical protein
MYISSSGFIAQISYLEDKIAKIQKNSPWGHFGGILGEFWGNFGIFWELFGFWDIFKILYFLNFL